MALRGSGSFHQFQQLLKRFDVDANATRLQLKRAYLKKVKLWHPDVNATQEAKHKFLQLQDDYHRLEKLLANQKFLSEWAHYKAGGRDISHLDQDEMSRPSQSGSSYKYSREEDSENSSSQSRYYYYHSSPFNRHNTGQKSEDPFEQYRQWYEERAKRSASTNWAWGRGIGFPGQQRLFVLPGQIFMLLCLLSPFYFLHLVSKERRTHALTNIEDRRWLISRDIKIHLWEEFTNSLMSNLPLSRPNSQLLNALDSAVDVSSFSPKKSNFVSVPPKSTESQRVNVHVPSSKATSSQYGNWEWQKDGDANSSFALDQFSAKKSNRSQSDDAQMSELKMPSGVLKKSHTLSSMKTSALKEGEEGEVTTTTPDNASSSSAELKSQSKRQIDTQKRFPSSMQQDAYYYTKAEKSNLLHRAIIQRNVDACVNLLLSGVYVGFLDKKRRTALHYAAYSGQLDMCRLLLLFNANPLSLDGFQETPIDAARLSGHKKVEELLIFATTGSFVLAQKLSDSADEKIHYDQLFSSIVAANLGSFMPPDVNRTLKRLSMLQGFR